jgi:hypothetical protein
MGTAAQEGVPRPADRPEPGLADRLLRGDGDALEVHRFRHLYNTIRPHQALADRTPAQVYTAPNGGPGLVSA